MTSASAAPAGVTHNAPLPPTMLSDAPPPKIQSAAPAASVPPASPIAPHSPNSIAAIAPRLNPSERITATSLIRSRTIIAVEFAAIISTVKITIAQSASTIPRMSPSAESPPASASLSVRLRVS